MTYEYLKEGDEAVLWFKSSGIYELVGSSMHFSVRLLRSKMFKMDMRSSSRMDSMQGFTWDKDYAPYELLKMQEPASMGIP